MKTRNFWALAMAALAFVACDPNNGNGNGNGGDDTPTAVVITPAQAQYSVEAGATVQLEYTVTPADTKLTWESRNTAVATVDQNGLATGVAEGNTIITATAGEAKANFILSVIKAGGVKPGEKPTVKGSQIWTIIMDGETAESVADKIVFSFAPNDVTRKLYWWEGTYTGNPASGSNYFQTNSDGGFMSAMVAEGVTWSGMGYSIAKEDVESKTAVDELIAAIKADPAHYHVHMAIKSSQEGSSHYFAMFGLGSGNTTGLKWCVGPKYAPESNQAFTITYDGAWNSIDQTFENYVAALDTYTPIAGDDAKGMNILTIGSTGVAGNIINLDAFYIYKE